MLETVREYAWEQLCQHGEADHLQRRQSTYYLHLAEQAAGELESPAQAYWLARLDAERDNLRASLAWAAAHDELALGLCLVSALRIYWEMRTSLQEGYEWATALLASLTPRSNRTDNGTCTASDTSDEAGVPAGIRAAACVIVASLAQRPGNYDEAIAYGMRALTLYQVQVDEPEEAHALPLLGNTYNRRGASERAEELLRQALALRRATGDTLHEAAVLNNLGITLGCRGEHAQALPIFEAALAIHRALGDRRGAALVLYNIAQSYRLLGDFTRAMPLCAESIATMRVLGDMRSVALELVQLGELAYYRSQLDEARGYLRESATLAQQMGLRSVMVDALEDLGMVAYGQKDAAMGARLYGAAAGMRERARVPVPPASRPEYDHMLAALNAELGLERVEACWTAGAATPVDILLAASAEIVGLDIGG